jgi:hypothetical protein
LKEWECKNYIVISSSFLIESLPCVDLAESFRFLNFLCFRVFHLFPFTFVRGINTMAAYITRSSLELQTLCKAMGGEPQTISGLSGVGDLILTAFGSLSRNRSLGIKLSR